MKITPDSGLFTALSRFPDAGHARDAAAQRAAAQQGNVGDAANRGSDARDAIRQEIMRRRQQAAGDENQARARDARGDNTGFASALKAKQQTGSISGEPGTGTTDAGAFRREAPNVDTKPKFVRLGQLLDISV